MMKRSRESLAWGIVLVSFTACITLTVLFPFGTNALFQRATRPLPMTVRGIQGNPLESIKTQILNPGEAPLLTNAPAGMVTTGVASRGLIEVMDPEVDQLMARVEVLGDSDVRVTRANKPRFGRSTMQPHLFATLNRGRIRITVPPSPQSTEPLITYITTFRGEVAIDQPGKYTVELVNDEMQLSVIEGHAILGIGNQQLELITDTRGVIRETGGPRGPFSTARNLIDNGDFTNGLGGWTIPDWFIERSDQPTGETSVVDVSGEAALRIAREGVGNARHDIRQDVDLSVIDFNDLRVNIALRVLNHSLPVCGGQGTECPLTVRLEYEDENNDIIAWEQGFFVSGDVDPELAPNVCKICGFPVLYEHQRLPQFNELFFFESPNLILLMTQAGHRPSVINSITLTAEGHSFGVEIIEVSVIAHEEAQLVGERK